MTVQQMIYGMGAGGILAISGAVPMLFGQSFSEMMAHPLQAVVIVVGGGVAFVSTAAFAAYLMRRG